MAKLPKELEELASSAALSLLPEKSRGRYLRAFEDFEKWMRGKDVTVINETVVLAYMKEESEKKAPTTLWSMYSMLRTTLSSKKNIDISKFSMLQSFLKSKSRGYHPKKSAVLSEKEVQQFLTEAPDEVYLLEKVILVLGICGACRRHEIHQLLLSDVSEKGDAIYVRLRITKNQKPRSFALTDEFYDISKKYLALRPRDFAGKQLLVAYRNGKCIKQVVGIHTIGGIPKKIAKYLGLPDPECYTGHAFRRSSATIYCNSGANLLDLKRLGGWKSDAVAEGYIDESESKQVTACKDLRREIIKSIAAPGQVIENIAPDSSRNAQLPDTLEISNPVSRSMAVDLYADKIIENSNQENFPSNGEAAARNTVINFNIMNNTNCPINIYTNKA